MREQVQPEVSIGGVRRWRLQVVDAGQDRAYVDTADVVAAARGVDAGDGEGLRAQGRVWVPGVEQDAARVGREPVRAGGAADGCEFHAGDVSPWRATPA